MKKTKSNSILPPARLAAWLPSLTLAALTALSGGNALAGAFTGGNLVVERLGDGTETLSTNGNTIYFDEYTTSPAQAHPVQSIVISDGNTHAVAGESPMVESGTGGTTGSITLSPDGQTLTFPGYGVALPQTSSIVAATASAVPRALGTLNGGGTYTQVATSTVAFSGSNIRGAAADGENNFWGAGTASTTTVNSGTFYFGTTAAAEDVSEGNLRGVNVLNGALWFITDSSTPGIGIWEYLGQPTGASTPTRIVTFGSSDSSYNFAVNSSGTVIYDADDNGNSAGGIHKWTGSGTNWTLAYVMMSGTGCFGLAVNWNTTPPTLFTTTTTSSANKLLSIQDNGAASTSNVLATAAAKTFFRGVVFAPSNAVGITPPAVTGIFPPSLTNNASQTAQFVVSAIGAPPLSYAWFQGSVAAGNLLAGQTTSTLSLSNLLAANAGNYLVVVSNASGLTATSGVVSLTVNDPALLSNPEDQEGYVNGSVQFAVAAAGTGLTFQWYYSDDNGDASSFAPVPIGTLADGSMISVASGASNSTMTLANLQLDDAVTNFVVVINGANGSVTSSVVSLFAVNTSSSLLGFWNFNGSSFNNSNPPPFIGDGTASLVNLPPYTTTVSDPNDGKGAMFPYGQGGPPYAAWGTSSYPATNANPLLASNLQSGVRFNISTAGSRNIVISYETRASSTASDYEHLQYTIDGLHWSNYPASSTFSNVSGPPSGNGGFEPYLYDLSGFPGVDNNPDFGFRVVTEFQSTATYGAGVHGAVTNNYAPTANGAYGTTGTITYDMVAITGNDIVDTLTPPTIACNLTLTNSLGGLVTNTLDNVPITVGLTVGSVDMPVSDLTSISAVSLNTSTVNPTFGFSGLGTANPSMTIYPNPIVDSVDAAPILVTVTDTNGLVGQAWFYLTLTTEFLPPTNSFTTLPGTNMLANSSLTVPFTIGSPDVTPAYQGLTYTVTSDNNTLLPNANLVFGNTNSIHPTLTLTPAPGQLGSAVVTVTVSDNNPTEAKSTTANFNVMVRPNTNVVLIDYFNYDQGGALDQVNSGLWGHLTGILHQMKVTPAPVGGFVTLDTLDNTENLQAALLGAPFTNAGPNAGTLFASFTINMATGNTPVTNGTYFMVYNDGSGVTGNYECGVYAVTNGAQPGFYRVGIENWAGNGSENFSQVQIFPQDLSPGVNYVLVTELELANGYSTLWVDPTDGPTSTNVADTVNAGDVSATLYSISDLELRESGTDAGSVNVSLLKVGTSFDSVFPSLHIAPSGTNVVLNWSDPTLGIQSATNVAGPYSDVIGAEPPYIYTNYFTSNVATFFKFGQ